MVLTFLVPMCTLYDTNLNLCLTVCENAWLEILSKNIVFFCLVLPWAEANIQMSIVLNLGHYPTMVEHIALLHSWSKLLTLFLMIIEQLNCLLNLLISQNKVLYVLPFLVFAILAQMCFFYFKQIQNTFRQSVKMLDLTF